MVRSNDVDNLDIPLVATFNQKRSRFLCIHVFRHLLQPGRLSQADGQMHHHAAVISAVPVRRSSRASHNISDLDALWSAALVAHPAGSCLYLQDLPIFVLVPVRASAWEKCHMIAHDAVLGASHLVHVDVARECVGSFGSAGAASLGRVADDGARHCWTDVRRAAPSDL